MFIHDAFLFFFLACCFSRALFCSSNFIAGLFAHNELAASLLNVIRGQSDLLVDGGMNIYFRLGWYNKARKHLNQWKADGSVIHNSGHGLETYHNVNV